MKFKIILLYVITLYLFCSCKCVGQVEVRGALDDAVIVHTGYTVSYNPQAKLPNWVAYELTAEEVQGTVKRDNRFYPDPDVDVPQATNEDYRNSGWDKGHMAPAGDMKWSEAAMRESCYFTNICPQNRNLNGGDWQSLEKKCRTLAQRYGSVQIVCGPILRERKYGTLGAGRVVIPDAFYKVLLVKIGDVYEGIGFVFENKAGHRALESYAVSIDEVEAMTGLDFFHFLSKKKEARVEAGYHWDVWR